MHDLGWLHTVSFVAIVRDTCSTTSVGGLATVTVIITIEGWGGVVAAVIVIVEGMWG